MYPRWRSMRSGKGFIIGIHPGEEGDAGILQRLLNELVEAVGEPPALLNLSEQQGSRGGGGTERPGIRELPSIDAQVKDVAGGKAGRRAANGPQG